MTLRSFAHGIFFCIFFIKLTKQDSFSWSTDENGQTVVNGGCYVQNGILHDQNAGVVRPLTPDERAQLQEFDQQMAGWNRQVQTITQNFAQRMSRIWSEPGDVRMDPFPPMPRVPCLCKNCASFVNVNSGGNGETFGASSSGNVVNSGGSVVNTNDGTVASSNFDSSNRNSNNGRF